MTALGTQLARACGFRLGSPLADAPSRVEVFTTSGTWVCPNGVTQAVVECWGGGGAGGAQSLHSGAGGGGGGGAYSRSVLTVVPGTSYPYIVGAAGASNPVVNGGDTSFNTTSVVAKGGVTAPINTGAQGTGGQASAGTGDVKYDGGGGGQAFANIGPPSGVGGASGYPGNDPLSYFDNNFVAQARNFDGSGNGALGDFHTGSGSLFAGTPAGRGGGPGGPGINTSPSTPATAATGPGGGGGGGQTSAASQTAPGAAGKAGQVRITSMYVHR